MDLSRAFERFATMDLLRWNKALGTYEPIGVAGSLQVYDRFVSDRDFGQKKRLFLVPGQFAIDQNQLVLKIAGLPEVWLLEGLNNDAQYGSAYASVLVLREGSRRLKLYKPGGTKRASGVGYTARADVLVDETYGDFSRYSSTESKQFDNVDYTIGSWYLPRGTPVDLDTVIEDDFGQRFQVKEVSSFLDLLMVRVQERESA